MNTPVTVDTSELLKNQDYYLDLVLRTLLAVTERAQFHKDAIFQNAGLSLTERNSYIIIQKLILDGYVAEATVMLDGSPVGTYQYYITLNGAQFVHRGGYTKETERLRAKNLRATTQTLALGVGSVLAGLYGLFEMMKALLKHYKILPDVFSISAMALICVFLVGGILTTILYLLLKETRKKQ